MPNPTMNSHNSEILGQVGDQSGGWAGGGHQFGGEGATPLTQLFAHLLLEFCCSRRFSGGHDRLRGRRGLLGHRNLVLSGLESRGKVRGQLSSLNQSGLGFLPRSHLQGPQLIHVEGLAIQDQLLSLVLQLQA